MRKSDSVGSSASNSSIVSRNASSFEARVGRGPQLGGSGEASALRIVSRCTPVRRWISRCEALDVLHPPDLRGKQRPSSGLDQQISQIKGPVGHFPPRAAMDHS